AACTPAPVTNTHLRRRTRTTSGVRNACGSIDPDSRIGTSSPTSAAGTPSTWNTHGSTVEALTVWSPEDCSVLAATSFRPLRGTSRCTSSGRAGSAGSTRVTSTEYRRSGALTLRTVAAASDGTNTRGSATLPPGPLRLQRERIRSLGGGSRGESGGQ